MKSTEVEFLKDYVFSIDGKPVIAKKGDSQKVDECTAKILVRNKACKYKDTRAKAKK